MLSSQYRKFISSSIETPDNYTEELLDFQELGYELQNSIRKLPRKSRTIFELSRGKNFSNKQIAGKLNISEKNVEYHLGKCRKLLRVYLKDFVTILVFFQL